MTAQVRTHDGVHPATPLEEVRPASGDSVDAKRLATQAAVAMISALATAAELAHDRTSSWRQEASVTSHRTAAHSSHVGHAAEISLSYGSATPNCGHGRGLGHRARLPVDKQPAATQVEASQVEETCTEELRQTELETAELEETQLEEAVQEVEEIEETQLEEEQLEETLVEDAVLEEVELEVAALDEAMTDATQMGGVLLEELLASELALTDESARQDTDDEDGDQDDDNEEDEDDHGGDVTAPSAVAERFAASSIAALGAALLGKIGGSPRAGSAPVAAGSRPVEASRGRRAGSDHRSWLPKFQKWLKRVDKARLSAAVKRRIRPPGGTK